MCEVRKRVESRIKLMKISRMNFFHCGYVYSSCVSAHTHTHILSIMWNCMLDVIWTKHKHVLMSAINFLRKTFHIKKMCVQWNLVRILMSFFNIYFFCCCCFFLTSIKCKFLFVCCEMRSFTVETERVQTHRWMHDV